MKISPLTLLSAVLAGGAAVTAYAAEDEAGASTAPHAVFVMTNSADSNEVIAYERSEEGTLHSPRRHATGGRGSGGTVDPLASQGALTLSDDRSVLLAANAGSGTLSVLRVSGSHLELTDQVPTGGSEPNAVAQHGSLVYVLNTAGSSSVVGFHLSHGKLIRIPDSLRFLSGNLANSSSVSFSPDGRHLAVVERASNKIDIFQVQSDGRLSAITVNPSAGAGAFAGIFAPDGALIVAETGPGGTASSTMSSYMVGPQNQLVVITAAIPTLGAANCWNAFTPDGRFVYASNAGSSSIAGFAIESTGGLSPLPGTVLGVNPSGSSNLDIAVSADGQFLYSLNAGNGTIGMFAIRSADGTLTNLGVVGGLPAGAGLNGIAAN
jgi:6-phosphogluconolactonase (cycloisomerase 2 family)